MVTLLALTLSQVNLLFQILILSVVLVGFAFSKRGRFLVHGSIMLVAIALNAASFILVMGPSFLSLIQLVAEQPLNRISIATMAHGILGAIAEVLGIYMVAFWGLRRSVGNCARRRRTMQATLMLWITALVLGILLYAILYTNLLGV
jgi:uncharacterized membrane protein YozB (DUF420 family)